jgi:penicillin G amidase
LRRTLIVVAAVIGVLVLVAATAAVWSVRRAFPTVDGELTLVGLSAEVEIIRDEWGVPHIYAETPEDLFRAQGYVQAQDRAWHMEMNRRVGAGRMSELFGEDQIGTDRFIRTIGWRRAAEAEWDLISDDARGLFTAHAEGVSSYFAERAPGALGLEFTLLRFIAPGVEIEPWDPVDSLTWMKVMAWDLRSNYDNEIERALLSRELPVERVDEVFAHYPDRFPSILTAAENQADPESADAAPAAIPEEALDLFAAMAAGQAGIDALLGPGGISNSWVIGPELTANGAPLLANDPHLGARLPSLWHEVGLHCRPVTDACPFDVRGFSLPGVPGVVIGNNARVAWGLTNLGADVMDLYVERLDAEDPDRYEVNGEFVEMEVIEEEIRVAGGDPVVHRVRLTRHGPVMSDVSGQIGRIDDESALEVPAEHAIALRWTALEPGRTPEAIFALNTAHDWESFRAAAELFEVPVQNLVYADVDGNIGYQMPGRIPIRAAGDGRWPVPGWDDEHAWTGFIPFDDLPHALNPPKGYIVTANNAVVRPDEYPHHITVDWGSGHRAQRIDELIIAAGDAMTADDMARMQLDETNMNARDLLSYVTDLDVGGDERLERALEVLDEWDGVDSVDSAGAAVFNAWWRHLLARTFHPEMPEDIRPNGRGRWFEVVRVLAEDPGNAWWNDPSTPSTQTRDDMMLAALDDAVTELSDRLGDDPDRWEWGELHTLQLVHQPLGESGIGLIERIFNRGPYPVGGGNDIVNAIGWHAPLGYRVVSLPSLRMVVELTPEVSATGIHTSGQSGHAFHRHYTDMAEPWAAGHTKPMRFHRDEVVNTAVSRLRLVP